MSDTSLSKKPKDSAQARRKEVKLPPGVKNSSPQSTGGNSNTCKAAATTKRPRGTSISTNQTETEKVPTLSARQERFIDEYMIDSNATQAAIRAGYSRKTAQEQSSRLLSNVIIRNIVDQRRAKLAKSLEITAERVLQEVGRLAFLDIRRAFDAKGNLLPLDQIDDDTAAAIAGLEVMEEFDGGGDDRTFAGYLKKIKLSDKRGALELLMRHLGMLNDKMKLQGDPENPLTLLHRQISGTAFRPREE